MYQLYYAAGACSLAIHALIREVGAEVELHAVNLQAPRPPELLKLNPRGSVPVLIDGAHVLREGAAIMVYLAEKHKSDLLPSSGSARARALEWLMFANSTLHPAYGRVFFLSKQLGADAASHPLYATAIAMVQKLWDEVEAELSAKPYLCGDAPTLADILVSVIGNWGGWLQQPITLGTNTKAMFARISERPAFVAAMKAENVSYQAAA